MTLLWFDLAMLYAVFLLTLGRTTLRNGHGTLFLLGLVVPIVWIVRALLDPTRSVRPVVRGIGMERVAAIASLGLLASATGVSTAG